MNIVNKCTAWRLRDFLLPMMLLAGCAVIPLEPSSQYPVGASYPDAKNHERAPPVSERAVRDSAPAMRRGAAPQMIEPPLPVQPRAAAIPQVQPPQLSRSPAATGSTMPFPVQACDAGGCFGPGGDRYGGGVGNVYLDGSGRQCRRMGEWMQCN